ncbi:MFS transporter [Paraburkholderia sp. 22B1P]|uniref:MFS transporter n=1 Tax=Paraburkholderia sp. 22B1P TaxID=3080498 RepID=UPI0030875B21|nr:MFS transporter [Paraburkholderia sp. 22B1P]
MNQQVLEISDRLERLPLSRFHYAMLAVVGLMMFFDGYDLLMSGLAIPSLRQIGWLNASTTSTFLSVPLISAAFGSVAAGFIGDKLGRKKLFNINVIGYSALSVCCGFAWNGDVLIVFRALTMFVLGMQVVTGYSYLNEFMPAAYRGRFQAAIALIVNAGLPCGAVFARLVLPDTDPHMGWRYLFLVSLIPGIALLFLQRYLPESPRWLDSVGREKDADKVVAALERRVGVKTLGPSTPRNARKEMGRTAVPGWSALLGSGLRSRFLLAVFFEVGHLVALTVMVSWLPSLLAASGMSLSGSLTFTAVSFAGGFAGPLIAIFISDRFERKWSIVGASLFAAGCAFAYGFLESGPLVMVVGFALVSAIFFLSSVGMAAYVPEILPTGVRLRGMGASVFCGRIASAASPFVVAILLSRGFHPFAVVVCAGSLYLLTAIVVAVYGPKTRGRTLEELEAEMSQSPEADVRTASQKVVG